jgi:glyoxylase-like metal-dependent hydrolase (beta-lactamase superfamily II)
MQKYPRFRYTIRCKKDYLEHTLIVRKLVVGPYASNCYIVGSEETKEGMIIDPGADAKEILRAVAKLGLTIKLIVLTHRHPDHVGAAAPVKKATGAPVAVHAECAKYLPQSSSYLYEPPFEAAPYPDRILKEDDSIDVGGLHFTVLHTPGHTPCGISIYGEGHVFTGDTLFNYGIGRYDLIDGDYHQLINGIKTKLLTLPPETIVHPGHGPDSTISTEKRANPFLK